MRLRFAGESALTLFVLAALSLAACGAGGGQAGATPGEAHASPAQSSPAGTKVTGLCANQYLPVVKGATWSYERTNSLSSTSSRIDNAITDVGPTQFKILSAVGKFSAEEVWTCTKEGLLRQENSGGAFGAVLRGPTGSATVTVRENTGITVPANVKAGDTWTQKTAFDIQVHDVAITVRQTANFKALGPDQVAVPAGTFNAMRVSVAAAIEYTQSGYTSNGNYDATLWWAAGIGSVKNAGTISVAGGGGLLDYADVLQSYSIPKQ